MSVSKAVQAALLLLLATFQPASARVHGLNDRVLKGARPSPTPAVFYRPQLPAFATPPFTTAAPNTLKTFNQFAISGDISAASAASITVHGVQIACPTNLVVQLPANTAVWADATPGSLVGYEAQVIGNVVNEQHVAALIYVSTDFANIGQGVITAITGGVITVATASTPTTVVNIMLNDPTGQYGAPTVSPDDRFCVDNQNPTVTSSTGYPMCVPRSASDPLCPSTNRPTFAGGWCNNFAGAGVPAAWRPIAGDFVPLELSHPGLVLTTSICSAFVMPPVEGFVLSGIDLAVPSNLQTTVPTVTTGSPDPRTMAPFVVGDVITWSGAKFPNDPSGLIWAHAIQADVAIYTFPGTLPAYLAIQEFSISSGNAAGTSIAGTAQESKDRFSMEAIVTDVLTPVDFYAVDIGNGKNGLTMPLNATTTRPADLKEEVNRWMTTSEMTAGTSGPLVGPAGAKVPIGGGIITAHTFTPINRQRLQANPAPRGYVDSPTRNYRAMYRSLCLPPARYLGGPSATPTNVFTLPATPATATAPAVPAVAAPAVDAPINTTLELNQGMLATPCVERAKISAGLLAGTYTAPVFTYIFPEALVPGDPAVPANVYNFDFLVNGEAGAFSAGGLNTPTPW